MNTNKNEYKRSDVVMIACFQVMAEKDVAEVHEADLTVACWQFDQKGFGLRKHESKYPDHNSVLKVLMNSKSKPLRDGFMKRTRPNHYTLTAAGKLEVQRLLNADLDVVQKVSDADIYDKIKPYIDHRSFKLYQKDSSQPKSWMFFSSFFNVSDYDEQVLNDSIQQITRLVHSAISHMETNKVEELKRGPRGGKGKSIHLDKVKELQQFIGVMLDRFSTQIEAIRT